MMNRPLDPNPAAHPVRHYPAHPTPIRRVNRPTILFVTVCLSRRVDLLGNETMQTCLQAAWTQADHWRVGRYLVMPDHIHLFCAPGVIEPLSVKRWVRRWKETVSRRAPVVKGQWQRDCWDTQMRDQKHYDERLAYVMQNPVRAGLVERAEDWPYTGRLHELMW